MPQARIIIIEIHSHRRLSRITNVCVSGLSFSPLCVIYGDRSNGLSKKIGNVIFGRYRLKRDVGKEGTTRRRRDYTFSPHSQDTGRAWGPYIPSMRGVNQHLHRRKRRLNNNAWNGAEASRAAPPGGRSRAKTQDLQRVHEEWIISLISRTARGRNVCEQRFVYVYVFLS